MVDAWPLYNVLMVLKSLRCHTLLCILGLNHADTANSTGGASGGSGLTGLLSSVLNLMGSSQLGLYGVLVTASKATLALPSTAACPPVQVNRQKGVQAHW